MSRTILTYTGVRANTFKIIYQGSARGCDKVGVKEFKSLCADTGVCEYCTGHEGAFGLGILQENI